MRSLKRLGICKQMKANPGKFQAAAVGLKIRKKSPVFKVGNMDIVTENVLK